MTRKVYIYLSKKEIVSRLMILFFWQVQLDAPGIRTCFLFKDAIIRFPYVNLIILYNVTRAHFAADTGNEVQRFIFFDKIGTHSIYTLA